MSTDLLYDIQTSQVGINAWDVTMISQPGSVAALRMGSSGITLRFYGTQQEAICQAKQFMAHNGVGP